METGAKSPVRVWQLETTKALQRCQSTAFFVCIFPLSIIAGYMGRSSDLPVSFVAGLPTLCNPLFVFGRALSGRFSFFLIGEIRYG